MTHDESALVRQLTWSRRGATWRLTIGRRCFGTVVSDAKHPGMWRSAKSGGRLSDMANLSWSKNAVLVAAERELDYEARHEPAITPSFAGLSEGVFPSSASLVHYSSVAASSLPSSL
jgi:hypothetical protein